MNKALKTAVSGKLSYNNEDLTDYKKVKIRKFKIRKTNFNKFLNLFSLMHLPIFCFSEGWLGAYEDTIQLNAKFKNYQNNYKGD